MPRYLGIDYGRKRIGLAISDDQGRIAMPVDVLGGTGDPIRDAAAVLAAAEDHEADQFVVGLPLNMDGTEGPQAKLTRRFATELARLSGKPTDFQDERLSSAGAESLIEAHPDARARRRRPIDPIAAQILLQNFLDSHPRAP